MASRKGREGRKGFLKTGFGLALIPLRPWRSWREALLESNTNGEQAEAL